MKLIALEEAFWYDKLSTAGTPDAHIPVKPEVIADWRRRLPDFTEYRLPDMDNARLARRNPGRTRGPARIRPTITTPAGCRDAAGPFG